MEKLRDITSLLLKTYEKNAWYGPSVLEALENITQELALKRLPNTHSIIELVTHMTAWRNYTVSKLTGGESTMTEEMNFPDTTEWVVATTGLHKSQTQLLNAIKYFPEERLQEMVPEASHPYTFYTLLHGIIHHDIYHTGQIVLIKKMYT